MGFRDKLEEAFDLGRIRDMVTGDLVSTEVSNEDRPIARVEELRVRIGQLEAKLAKRDAVIKRMKAQLERRPVRRRKKA